MVEIKYRKSRVSAKDPIRMHEGDACYDVYGSDMEIDCELGVVKYFTGIVFDIPKGYSIRVHPRSSTYIKHGLVLANSEGIIDSGYKDEVVIIYKLKSIVPLLDKIAKKNKFLGKCVKKLYNIDEDLKRLYPINTRVAQIELVAKLEYSFVEGNIDPSSLTRGGLGSTGDHIVK